MNGAESLVRTLLDSGVEVCFTNPGTSEMHFVAALDRIPGMRCVLGLFEGVVTGAADGYARMADKPAATLLHCGPGLGNGLANLHNARKAGTAVVNIVGDHATWHVAHDAPLAADVLGIAAPVSHWVRLSDSARSVAADGAEAVAAARRYPGQVASLVLPGDTAWDSCDAAAAPVAVAAPPTVDASRIEAARAALVNGKRTALILGGRCLREAPLALAGRIHAASGARLLSLNNNARTSRGRGRVPVQAIPYPVDQALDALADIEQVITVESRAPVAFFAYPDKPSRMLPPTCTVLPLAERGEDGPAALQALAAALGATAEAVIALPPLPDKPAAQSALDPEAVNTLIAHHLPEHAVLVDEGITAARNLQAITAAAAPHELLQICGGSIGIGPPLALGAAIACPDRKVVALQADGSAMYTIQALWTQAREQLDVVTVLVNNRAYAILQGELKNVGAQSGNAAGEIARDMMRLDRPELNFVDLARGMGVPGTRVHTVGELDAALAAALAGSGPHLIEAMV